MKKEKLSKEESFVVAECILFKMEDVGNINTQGLPELGESKHKVLDKLRDLHSKILRMENN